MNPGPVDADNAYDVIAGVGSPEVAVICGTDARYNSELAALVEAAHAAGIAQTYLAGSLSAVADIDESHLPDQFLTTTIDAVKVLSDLLSRLGA